MADNADTKSGSVFWENNPGDQKLCLETGRPLQKVFFCNEPADLHWQFDLTAAKASLDLLIIFIGHGSSHLDLRLDLQHLAAHTRSRITLKAILFDQARLNFLGNIIVPKAAQKTETFMRCDSLILSKSAKVRAVPALEIVANDVKAGHSATTGQIDADSLFYLQTRGFSSQQAKKLLVEAFLLQTVAFFKELSAENTGLMKEKLMRISDELVL